MNPRVAGPWYREPWPWILMSGPFVVVIAGFITLWLAIRSNDGLVNDHYYEKGLDINQTLARSARAQALGLSAGIRLTVTSIDVRLTAKAPGFAPPPALRVTMSHPTRAGLDQSAVLAGQNGSYHGSFRLPAAGHWVVLIEDDARTWRLEGNIILPAAGETLLDGKS